MTVVHASAPGKLFLLGEYAVLHGAPALLTAVDRRVSVSITDSDDARWHLRTLGLADATGSIVLGAHGVIPGDVDARTRERLRVFDAVRETVAGAVPGLGDRALSIDIDSTAFFAQAGTAGEAHKLGLGSSAAVATALTAALSTAAGVSLGPEDIRTLATTAHRAAQHGTGSGGDVATSSYGGLVSYVRDTPPTPLAWPEELSLLVVSTGTGSSTTELVGRVKDYARTDADGHRDDIDRLATLAAHAEDALRAPQEFLRLAEAYFEALLTLDEHCAAGIVSEHHRALHALAAQYGGAFKTSGAGGGDVGLVFAPAGAAIEELRTAFAQAGAQAVPLGFGANGVETTAEPTEQGNTGNRSVTTS
jgi:mevalonate kinase